MKDERAKDMLDFLARKAGYDGFSLATKCLFVATRGKMVHLAYVYAVDDSLQKAYSIVADRCFSYAKALQKIFAASAKGLRIVFANDTYQVISFMQAHATIEQIEIEMDLDANDK